jgi:hypothetical protein
MRMSLICGNSFDPCARWAMRADRECACKLKAWLHLKNVISSSERRPITEMSYRSARATVFKSPISILTPTFWMLTHNLVNLKIFWFYWQCAAYSGTEKDPAQSHYGQIGKHCDCILYKINISWIFK